MPNPVTMAPHKAEAWIEDHKKLVYGGAAIVGLYFGWMWYKNSSGSSSSSALPSPGTTGTTTGGTTASPGIETIKIEILKHTTTGTKANPGQLKKAFGRGMIFGEIKTLTQRRNFLLSEQQNALKHKNWGWLAKIQAQLRANAKLLNPLRKQEGWGAVRPTAGVKAHPVNTIHKKPPAPKKKTTGGGGGSGGNKTR